MSVEKSDIATAADIQLMVDSFYLKVQNDDLLGPVFNDFAKVDWEKHLPIMYNFWGSILTGTHKYSGQPFPKHMGLPITATHFDRWVQLFTANVDEHFKGNTAEEAKLRAHTIAQIFMSKLGL